MGLLDAPGYSRTQADARYQLKYGATEVTLSTNSANAAANVTAINNAISAANTAGGGIVTISVPGTYFISDHILMRSNVTLRMATGVIIKKVASATNNVCLLRNANLSTTRPYGDSNMVIEGGTFDGNYTGNSTQLVNCDTTSSTVNTLQYGVQGDLALIGVSHVTIRNVTIQNCNGFGTQIIGDGVTIENINFNTARDGIHVNGPSKGIVLRNIYGYTDDDFIALNAWDWHKSGPSVGDIENVAIEDITSLGTSGIRGTHASTVKLLSGTRTTGAGQGTGNIRGVSMRTIRAENTYGINIISDFDQVNGAEYSGTGLIENVVIDGAYFQPGTASDFGLAIQKLTQGSPADGQTALTIRNFVVRNAQFNCLPGSTSNAVWIVYAYTGLSVQGLVFRDCSFTPRSTAGAQFMNIQSKSTLDSIEVDGLTYLASTVGNAAICLNTYDGTNASNVKTLIMNRIATAPGVTVDGPILNLNGICQMLYAREWVMTFTGGGSDNHGINFANSVALLQNAVLSNLNLTNPKELFRVGAGASGSLICKAVVRDSNLVGCTHPVFISGSRQADISFRGGNIDTPANLARVDTSTLTLTLDGTTSSGVGATTITQVSTTTLRVPRTDRISLPLNTLTLTPSDGDWVYSSATPTTVVSGTGAGQYIYRGSAGWVKLN